jgi:hypothetical protein
MSHRRRGKPPHDAPHTEKKNKRKMQTKQIFEEKKSEIIGDEQRCTKYDQNRAMINR